MRRMSPKMEVTCGVGAGAMEEECSIDSEAAAAGIAVSTDRFGEEETDAQYKINPEYGKISGAVVWCSTSGKGVGGARYLL